jgi:L-ascorbate metabolism protein UlaG (beta-lactamase superfamily)
MVELKRHLGNQGANVGNIPGVNKGGTQTVDGVRFTLTDARHSSAGDDNEYLGEAAGLVVRLADGTSIYFAGDTCVFGDMQLIGRLYQPNVAVLPIGDHFTMGPEEAAVALELLGNPRCVPCHYGTFPVLTGTPEALGKLTEATLEVLEPGGTLEL